MITLGLTLDASGFIRHSEVFEGNVSEGSTLQKMLDRLQAPAGALVIMDAGIVRQAPRPEEEVGHLYNQLGISPAPGGRQRLII